MSGKYIECIGASEYGRGKYGRENELHDYVRLGRYFKYWVDFVFLYCCENTNDFAERCLCQRHIISWMCSLLPS